MSDPRLLHKQYQFCERQKEPTDEFKAKDILYPFPRCFQNVQKIFKLYRIFPRRVTAAYPPPPEYQLF